MENTNEAPSYGYRSYAELIKQRLIYGRFYSGWSMRQGKYWFQVMYTPANDGHHPSAREPIGYEMVACGHPRRQNDTDNWVVRVYLDGTALYRPYKLGWLRYPTMRTITGMMDYFFYKEGEIVADPAQRYNKTHVLRRKPINPHHTAPVSKGFGEFLTTKYNKTEGA